MDKKRMTYVTMGFGVLLLVIVVLLVWGGRRQSGQIVLPESQSDSAGVGEDSAGSRLNTVTITPETVGAAISVLDRPASYTDLRQRDPHPAGRRPTRRQRAAHPGGERGGPVLGRRMV